MAWSVPKTEGPKPGPRTGHAALLVGETLLIHGGFCMDTTDIASKVNSGKLLQDCYLSDLRVLDLGRMMWSRLRTHGTPPLSRFGHSLVLSEDDIVLFGGWSGVQKEASQGVLFSLRHKVREDGGQSGGQKDEEQHCDYCVTLRTSDMRYVPAKFSGVAASRRYGHTATTIGPHLIIFGGWDGGKPLSDLIVLRDRSPQGQSMSVPPGDETLEGTLGFNQGDPEYGEEDEFELET
jgi:host cell factor